MSEIQPLTMLLISYIFPFKLALNNLNLFILILLLHNKNIFAFPAGETKIENTSPSFELPESPVDYYVDEDEDIDKTNFCFEARLRATAHTVPKLHAIALSFEVIQEKLNDCFTFFDIFLYRGKKVVASTKLPFNYTENKIATHIFENVSCGLYEIKINPCFNDFQCADFIVHYPYTINMSSSDCNRMSAEVLPGETDNYQLKIIAILTIATMLLMLSIGGATYCYYNSIHIMARREEVEKEDKKILVRTPRNGDFKRIKVYILNYSNKIILEYGEILKDFLSKLPTLCAVKDAVEVVLIKDELHKILFDRTWWINDALDMDKDLGERSTVKKVIIVDADKKQKGGSLDALENENENEVFEEAKTKLGQDWLKSLNDYRRIFVIRFNGLLKIRSEALKYVVPGVRYDICDDQLVSLSKILLSGSGLEYHIKEEDIKELIRQHPIKNLSSVGSEYC